MKDSRRTTTQPPDGRESPDFITPAQPRAGHATDGHSHHSRLQEFHEEIEEIEEGIVQIAGSVLGEVRELPGEIAEIAEHAVEEIEESRLGRWAVNAYVWLMARAPDSTRGRILAASVFVVIVLIPSLALLYFTWGDEESTKSWFGRFGYGGVFLSNLASTGTLFIPVPGLTAAAQALIVSSATSLSPFWVGILGGVGMAIGEITAYIAGMAAAVIAREEDIKPPSRLKPLIDRLTRGVNWLMGHYGMPTLFTLSVVPNPLFEIAGWTAGATRYPFLKFMASVTPGKVTRGLLLAYLGEKVIFG